ncbi:MAG: Re/Si-specific NAD(P)(+) transhydrogenase subunit alpha [Porticoccaceae bacterium]|nr:MAG: NAD(P) transhydrogenase subunit alpha [SAR92 bacterium BACL16 MAG-120619-bin48]KRP24662.1 MAG: NAD(P) transhydrogenase subunit alpha [SAR92 bacterium BACL16 MAG-120322-bin99]MDP4655046.1 Re/Si-specific NAD(P)(+) transhydrogenase subunit alpha [Alphaproteobacteria bacterium]MDP4745223.1 Re/Si-specific NAD(P)(+) transhydrogenase subunit alpha [Porticoccaceae bacterium]MDP4753334.1 Re/Si-specific NAD(P)(+) transhydrogenase subunit alpha [Porticoccaceae bacterium]
MIIGIPSEIKTGERRVAMSPVNVKSLTDKGIKVLFQANAGDASGYPDAEYEQAGATITTDRAEIFAAADILLQVQTFGSNNDNSDGDLASLRSGQVVIGMMDPLATPSAAQAVAGTGATAIALELVPRISRAQSMDVLSSMATLAGYKAVLMGASASPRIFPMLMTAAGTLKPARVLIMGVGVAGLQACATAKRLGALVEAYDVRPAAREQIISVGAKPVELDLDTGESEGAGGYAKAQGEDFLRRQRELMTAVIAEQDIIITTAAIPGAKSPILVTEDMVKAMKPGSVIVDLAAERGGNCDLTQQGKTIIAHGVTIIGPENVPSELAYHATQMYGKNLQTLLELIIDGEGNLNLDFKDEIVAGTVVAHRGDVPHPHMRKLLGLPELAASTDTIDVKKGA